MENKKCTDEYSTNDIAISVIRRDVMKKIDEHPGRYAPLLFLKAFSVEKTNEWIKAAIEKYDSFSFVGNSMWTDPANKCLFVKIYREVVKDRIKDHEPYNNVNYFDVLSLCEYKYPGSFLIVHDCGAMF